MNAAATRLRSPDRRGGLARGLLALALLLLIAGPGGALAAELTITVENIRSDQGQIRISVYGSEAEWPDKPAKDMGQAKPAQVGSVVFKYDLPPGVYAVNAFHDEKDTGKFATNFLGMPLEGYGFSNDVRPNLLSAPSFYKAAFTLLPVGGVIHFKLVYP